jgi:hypothetical protein
MKESLAMTISSTPTVVQDIVDNADERELWIVGREFERPPYFHAGKGGDTRLARALRLCTDDKITPNSDGSYQVQGSEGRSYRVAESCSCPNSQKASTKWCYHAVGVALYVEWQRRLHPTAPVALGTLRAGTLPLPPTTVDERLAQAAVPLPDPRLAALATQVARGAMPDATALSTHHTPQEDRMPDDAYIPEPERDEAPVAVLDASDADFPPMGQPATRPLPGPVLLPSLDARTLEQSMQAYAAQRQVVTRYIKEQMTEGVDYYTLTIKGRVSKATLSKAGSEKFLSLFQLSAQFQQDEATWRMLGAKEGLLCYTCMLMTRSGEVIGEGRGARSVSQDGGDINKAIKMATKSAQVDAVLRTGALSDVFTQDLDDAPAAAAVQPTPAKPTSQDPVSSTAQDMRRRIWARAQQLAPEAKTREEVSRVIMERTGLALHPDHYGAILTMLEA